MIRRIQALNYRCLRHVDVALDPFHVLVGPNASGKSTLFDVVTFLGDMVRDSLGAAVAKRTGNFQDLVWRRLKDRLGFELAVEFDISDSMKQKLPSDKDYEVFRYEVAIKEKEDGVVIDAERGLLMKHHNMERAQLSIFPCPLDPIDTIMLGGGRHGTRTILSKSPEGRDNFNIEVSPSAGKGWATSISFGPYRSALGNLPESTEVFPVATGVKRMLGSQVKLLALDSVKMREASPPALRHNGFSSDGANLPWMIAGLQEDDHENYKEWLEHVRTTLKDIKGIHVEVRPDDRHAYLAVEYDTGIRVPSWGVSDGTLRFLALTLIPYLAGKGYLYLLEEPENSIHPLAIKAVYDSLASAYDSQVLVATHSSAFLQMVRPEEALCFAKDVNGATDIVRGVDHPRLRDWQDAMDMNLLFAKGELCS